MRKLAILLALSTVFCSTTTLAQVSEDEIKALREQIELLTKRLDQLERQNQELAAAQQSSASHPPEAQAVLTEAEIDEKVQLAVSEAVDEQLPQEVAQQVAEAEEEAWHDRMHWSGDFRYRYENTEEEGKDGRNRNRIRARVALSGQVSDTTEVGFGLATGGDDPVSANQTLGGGGSSKDIKLDLAYFDWKGLKNTRIVGGKYKNFLVRPAKQALVWDGDWRPEGIGIVWNNGTLFAQGLGTWLEGDSRNGTEFAYVAQAGAQFKIGETGKLKLGAGYNVFDIAGRTPLFGDPEDFYGNSFVFDPNAGTSGANVFAYDYREIQAFVEYTFKAGKYPVALFGDYVVNTEAPENDTGYLFGAKLGSASAEGSWDVAYYYKNLEKDAVVGLLTDSDFAGGGTDGKGHVLAGTYAFHDNWTFKATYFINQTNVAADPRDFDRLMLDMQFKFK